MDEEKERASAWQRFLRLEISMRDTLYPGDVLQTAFNFGWEERGKFEHELEAGS